MSLHAYGLGRLARDPDRKEGESGPIAKFAIAWNTWDFKQKESVGNFIRCVAFGKTAQTILDHLTKGTMAMFSGELQENQWTGKDGSNKRQVTLRVEKVEFLPRPKSDEAPSQRPQHKPTPTQAPASPDEGEDDVPF